MMASPDTITLLIVDYHTAIGGVKTPVPPPLLAYAPRADAAQQLATAHAVYHSYHNGAPRVADVYHYVTSND